MPSVLHRHAEDRGHRRARGQVPATLRQGLKSTDAVPARQRGRPYGAPFWCLSLCLPPPASHAAACPSQDIGERVKVVRIYDGDTVKLADGRRLRLIGINAPELHPKHATAEPFAIAARVSLEDLIDRHNRMLLLQFDQQHHDRMVACWPMPTSTTAPTSLSTCYPWPGHYPGCPNTGHRNATSVRRIRRASNGVESGTIPAIRFSTARACYPRQRLQHCSWPGRGCQSCRWHHLAGSGRPAHGTIGKQDQVNFPVGLLEHLRARRSNYVV